MYSRRRIVIVTKNMRRREGVWRYPVPRFPNNRKIRKRNTKEMCGEESAAQIYSIEVNWNWNQALCKAFGLHPENLGEWDFSHAYDEYVRQNERLSASIREAYDKVRG